MTAPTFGMQFMRPNDEPVPVLGADFSKMLLIEESANANATMFPVGVPVRFSSSDPLKVAGLGTGPLAAAVKGINDQMASINAGADITVVRTADTATPAAAAAGILAALQAAPTYPAIIGATPRLVWCGRTAWRVNLATTNPIVAAMPAILDQLMAISIVDVDDTSTANAISARSTMNSQRMMPIGVAARVYEGNPLALVTRPMGPRILGLIANSDNRYKGKPFRPFANRPVYGLAGLTRPINFSLVDGSTEGQQMLAADISIIAKGQTGVDGSIANGGYMFIGTDNTDSGNLWKQIHQVRGSDFITTELLQITRQFLGNQIDADIVTAWLNSMKFMLRDHKADNDILGFEVDFPRSLNSDQQIRLGQLTVKLGIEPASVFKLGNHEIRRYRPALEGLVSEIIARLNGYA